jgi:hypothetical protein
MEKLQPIFGFDVNYDENGSIQVNDLPNYPQEKKNSRKFFEKLEQIKIAESKITFPLMIKDWFIVVKPTNKETIMAYFKIDGIKKVVEENKTDLIGKTTFIKPEIYYPPKSKYPNLIIHFFQLVDDSDEIIYDEFDLIDYCQIYYENTKQFTKKRIGDLEKYLNTQELFQIPYLPLEMVRFDEMGNLLDFENHKLAKNKSELPF